jgi:tRNA pseudouridine13 synthase
MWGRGIAQNKDDSLLLEQQVLSDWNAWKQGLEKAGLSQERRALRVFPSDFSWQFLDNNQLETTFFLPAGSYATAVLRELAVCTNVQQRN